MLHSHSQRLRVVPDLIHLNIPFYFYLSNYFEAQKKLDEALEIAQSINDEKSIGLLYSKKGQLQLIIEEPNEAIISINKAIEVQRFAKDYENLGNSYKTFGDIYRSKKNYRQAIDYYISAQSLFEQAKLNNNPAEVLLC